MNSGATLSPAVIPALPTAPRRLSFCPRTCPGLHTPPSHPVSAVSSLGQALQPLTFMIITFLKSGGQLFYRVLLTLGAPHFRCPWCFPKVRLGLRIFGRNTTERTESFSAHHTRRPVKVLHLLPGQAKLDRVHMVPTRFVHCKDAIFPL